MTQSRMMTAMNLLRGMELRSEARIVKWKLGVDDV